MLRLKPWTLTLVLSCCASGFSQCSISRSQFGALGAANRLSTTTGNVQIDRDFGRILNLVSSDFGVRPGFLFESETVGTNARALPDGLIPGTDATVLFGRNMIFQQLQSTGNTVNFTIPAIVAHEFTHVVQFQRGSNLAVMGQELQADYMAGWWISKAALYPGGAQAISQNLLAFFRLGDYAFTDPDHHGTPQQRQAAILQGMRQGRSSFDEAFSISYELFLNAGMSSGAGHYGSSLREERSSANNQDQAEPEATIEHPSIMSKLVNLVDTGRLRSIETAIRTEQGDHIARLKLPEADRCVLVDPGPFEYICSFSVSDTSAATELIEALRQDSVDAGATSRQNTRLTQGDKLRLLSTPGGNSLSISGGAHEVILTIRSNHTP